MGTTRKTYLMRVVSEWGGVCAYICYTNLLLQILVSDSGRVRVCPEIGREKWLFKQVMCLFSLKRDLM